MINFIFILLPILFLTFCSNFCQPKNLSLEHFEISNLKFKDYSYLRDTVYTTKNYFIELNLNTQKGYLHSKEGWEKAFDISSGTKKIENGMETKEGLYVIQVKLPKWYSIQFDSTLMLYYMGFNFGVGMHALQTNGYYRYLGKRKSSQGCIRLSRKVAKELFEIVEIGTPVLISNGFSAVKVAFADSSNKFEKMTYVQIKTLIESSLKNLYSGRYFLSPLTKILIDKSNTMHSGLPLGNSDKILQRQIKNSTSEFLEEVIHEPRKPVIVKAD